MPAVTKVSSKEFARDPDRYLQDVARGRTLEVTAPSGSFMVLPSVPENRTAEVVNFVEFIRQREGAAAESRDWYRAAEEGLARAYGEGDSVYDAI